MVGLMQCKKCLAWVSYSRLYEVCTSSIVLIDQQMPALACPPWKEDASGQYDIIEALR